MRHEWAADYFYEGEWIEFSRHVSRADAIKDRTMLLAKYTARIRELHPQRTAELAE